MTPEETIAHYAEEQAAGRLPRVALSIQQPWAWLMVNGHKDIENRTWRRRAPPSILVHAGLRAQTEVSDDLLAGRHPVTGFPLDPEIRDAYYRWFTGDEPKYGGFVGAMDFTGQVLKDSMNEWFMGPFGYVTGNPRPLPFLPWRGMLGFFPARVQP